MCVLSIDIGIIPKDDNIDGDLPYSQVEGISYNIDNAEKITEKCHSIHWVYPIKSNIRLLATLPLVFGDCVLHKLGNLTFECHHCKAMLWKVETKHEGGNFKWKSCYSSGKVFLDQLQAPLAILGALPLGNDVES